MVKYGYTKATYKEVQKLLRRSESNLTKDKNGENAPKSENVLVLL